MFNICYCGKASGYPHAPDCPYPLFRGTEQDELDWEQARLGKLAALKLEHADEEIGPSRLLTDSELLDWEKAYDVYPDSYPKREV